jgi:sugar O-acyltransferase (sialic acid O-acetyltransferase NeuD family)
MNRKQLILIGGGGHCKACIDVIESEGSFEIIGILDKKEKIGENILDYKIIGDDDTIPTFIESTVYFIITVGQISTPEIRSEIYKNLITLKANIATIISPKATVSSYSKIGKGSIIMHQAVVAPGAEIGENCIINTQALIEHDSMIGNNVHVSTNATVNGNCYVGEKTFIGSSTVLLQGITIAENVLIGGGSCVAKSIIEPGVYFGNPLKKRQV